jgi:hypothetical protein
MADEFPHTSRVRVAMIPRNECCRVLWGLPEKLAKYYEDAAKEAEAVSSELSKQ